MRTCSGSHHRGVLLRVALLDVPVVDVVVMIFRKDIGNTHLGGGRVAVGVLHVVVILRSCGTSYTSCSRCPRALQLRVRLVALRVAVEHIYRNGKLGQTCWQHYDINTQPGPACSQIGSCSYPSWDLRKKKA